MERQLTASFDDQVEHVGALAAGQHRDAAHERRLHDRCCYDEASAARTPSASATMLADRTSATTRDCSSSVVRRASTPANGVGGFPKAETERIWLFLVPLACVAA